MNDKIKLEILFISILLLFPLISIGFGGTISSNSIITAEIDKKDSVEKTLSTSVSYSESYIYIDDTDPSNNWETVNNSDWCIGSGTLSDPYIIKDVELTGNVLGSSIFIRNSRVYFQVINCTAQTSGTDPRNAGIELVNTTNGLLRENNCSNNKGTGIFLDDRSNNNTITQNILSHNDYHGFAMGYSSYNKITDNALYNNSALSGYNAGAGIYLNIQNHHNSISNNDINGMGNQYHGIRLASNCTYNFIQGNTIQNGLGTGISFYSNCSHNIVSNNDINNQDGAGIELTTSTSKGNQYNLIESNEISRVGMQGINIIGTSATTDSKGNTIRHNIINEAYTGTTSNAGAISINSKAHNTTVYNNSITNSFCNGIYVREAENCSITDNVIKENLKSGISVLHDCDNLKIQNNNIVENGKHGVSIDATYGGSFYIVVSKNTIANNENETGIVLFNVNFCNVTSNKISNFKIGILLTKSGFCQVSNNDLVNCTLCIYNLDETSPNTIENNNCSTTNGEGDTPPDDSPGDQPGISFGVYFIPIVCFTILISLYMITRKRK